MKISGVFFGGFVVVVMGIVLALWKAKVIERIGWGWTGIGILILLGIGAMLAAIGGKGRTIEIDRK